MAPFLAVSKLQKVVMYADSMEELQSKVDTYLNDRPDITLTLYEPMLTVCNKTTTTVEKQVTDMKQARVDEAASAALTAIKGS